MLKHILNFLLPHACLNCKQTVFNYGICQDCFKNLKPITPPYCVSCGFPLINRAEGVKCAPCLKKTMPMILRSAVEYNDNSKKTILYLKHADGHEVVPFMGNAMLRSIADFKKDIDCIIPVPLHKKRLIKRRYNQSADLSRYISSALNVKMYINVLLRVKNTESQGTKNFKKRHANIRGAFSTMNIDHIKDKTILLIDDVYTSGATITHCTNALKQAGAKRIIAVTFARVIKK